MKKYLLLYTIAILLVKQSVGQANLSANSLENKAVSILNVTLTGKITDSKTGEPLAGASV